MGSYGWHRHKGEKHTAVQGQLQGVPPPGRAHVTLFIAAIA